jgi:Zn-dependent peptidase ImmA (M78 family)
MLEKPEVIYRRANEIVRYCGTRDTLRIARELGIYVHFEDDFSDLLGMYTYRHKERHILLNPKMDEVLMQMVCAHEIGHDALHRELAKSTRGLQEFVLFDMRTDAEYEANAFASHLRIDEDELIDLSKQGYDVVQLAGIMETNVNMMLIKLNELNRMGWHLNLPYLPHGDFLKNISPEG